MKTKRDDILGAALVVFQAEGLKGARMERIAQVAHVSKRTLYKHFDSREALFAAICDQVLEILSRMTVPEFVPGQPVGEQFEAALGSYIAQTMTDAFLGCSRVILPEFVRNPDAARQFNSAFLGVDAPLERFVAQAMAAGELRNSDPAAATALLLALFKSTLLNPTLLNMVGPGDAIPAEKIVSESVQVFLARYAVSEL